MRTEVFPNQRISEKKKSKNDNQWDKDMVDSLILNYYGADNISKTVESEYAKMKSDYDLYNNIIDQKDFERECNAFGVEAGLLTDEIRPYNKTYNKIQVLLGEELKRPFDFRTVVVNQEGIRAKMAEKELNIEDFIAEAFATISQLVEQHVKQGINQEEELTEEESKAREEQLNQEIDKTLSNLISDKLMSGYNELNYVTSRERAASSILEYLERKLSLQELKNDNFKHALISGKEVSWVGVRNGVPVVKNINPLGFFHSKSPDTKYFEDGLYAGYSTVMSRGDIINSFYDILDPSDLDELEGGALGSRQIDRDMMTKKNARFYSNRNSRSSDLYSGGGSVKSNIGQHGGIDHGHDTLDVHHVEWRSMKKVYFLEKINEYGDMVTEMLPEYFSIPTYAKRETRTTSNGIKRRIFTFDGMELEEAWIPEIREGYRIGDVYASLGSKKYQARSIDNPTDIKLGYHGANYSNTNATNISMMRRMRPFQYLYLIIAHRLKTFVAQDRPPLQHFDVSMVDPKIGLEKTLYYMDQLNVNFFNPLMNAEQAGAYQRGTVTSSTDRSTMGHINNYVSLLEAIDNEIADVAGVTAQREGASSPYETAAAGQQAVISSNHVTEIYFQTHNRIWERNYNSLLQVAQMCWGEKGLVKQYVLDDLSIKSLDIPAEEISGEDIGIFISNNKKDNELFARLESLAEYALNSQQAKLSDIISIYKANSINSIEQSLKASEKLAEQSAQAAQEAEQASVKEAIQAEKERAETQHKYDMELKQLDIEGDLLVKELDVFKNQENLDVNENNVPDHLEIEKIKIKKDYDNKKLEFEKKKHSEDIKLREKQLKQQSSKSN